MGAAGLRRGAFIVFEGIDRCGKSTQAQRLVDNLLDRGVSAELWRFPDRTTAIGSMINGYLTAQQELDDHAIHLLFAANRWEKQQDLRDTLESGVTVVADRYSYSGVAFSAAKGLDRVWCEAQETGLPAPDAVFYLSLSLDEAAARGGFGEERYERRDIQEKVRAQFEAWSKGGLWRTFAAAQPIEVLESQLLEKATGLVEGAQDAAWARARLDNLATLLPDTHLDHLEPHLLATLLLNTTDLAHRLVTLRASLPTTNLSRAFAADPAALLRLGTQATLDAQLTALRTILPADTPIDRLVERAPSLLVADLDKLTQALQVVLPGCDPGELLAATPELAAATSLQRQAEVLSSCMPGHSAQRLIAQEPLLLVVDVIEVLGHIQLALPWSNPVTVLARWPELARWDCRDIVRRLATWV